MGGTFKKFVKEMTKEEIKITKELEEKLKEHMWLGNIRKLKILQKDIVC